MKVSKRKKNKRKRAYLDQVARIKPIWAMCPNNCGEVGPHFVPPSGGGRSPGFFMCEPLDKKDETD